MIVSGSSDGAAALDEASVEVRAFFLSKHGIALQHDAAQRGRTVAGWSKCKSSRRARPEADTQWSSADGRKRQTRTLNPESKISHASEGAVPRKESRQPARRERQRVQGKFAALLFHWIDLVASVSVAWEHLNLIFYASAPRHRRTARAVSNCRTRRLHASNARLHRTCIGDFIPGAEWVEAGRRGSVLVLRTKPPHGPSDRRRRLNPRSSLEWTPSAQVPTGERSEQRRE